jgi:predicted aspartyl protease
MLAAGAASAQTPQTGGAPCGPVKIDGQTRYPGEIWRDGQGQVHALPSCPLPPGPPPAVMTQTKPTTLRVPIQTRGGNYYVPGIVNNVVTLTFTVDSGASIVSIPANVVENLKTTGALSDKDFVGRVTMSLADGSRVVSQTFRLRSLAVGDWLAQDVLASVSPAGAPPLLGQTFFHRLKSWSIDNLNQTLVMEIPSAVGAPPSPRAATAPR